MFGFGKITNCSSVWFLQSYQLRCVANRYLSINKGKRSNLNVGSICESVTTECENTVQLLPIKLLRTNRKGFDGAIAPNARAIKQMNAGANKTTGLNVTSISTCGLWRKKRTPCCIQCFTISDRFTCVRCP